MTLQRTLTCHYIKRAQDHGADSAWLFVHAMTVNGGNGPMTRGATATRNSKDDDDSAQVVGGCTEAIVMQGKVAPLGSPFLENLQPARRAR
jgi:hypothetical protein